jgi:hypothetical protein
MARHRLELKDRAAGQIGDAIHARQGRDEGAAADIDEDAFGRETFAADLHLAR